MKRRGKVKCALLALTVLAVVLLCGFRSPVRTVYEDAEVTASVQEEAFRAAFTTRQLVIRLVVSLLVSGCITVAFTRGMNKGEAALDSHTYMVEDSDVMNVKESVYLRTTMNIRDVPIEETGSLYKGEKARRKKKGGS